jgi:2-keto-3-deoxy-6-phosphogluconate aldolase
LSKIEPPAAGGGVGDGSAPKAGVPVWRVAVVAVAVAIMFSPAKDGGGLGGTKKSQSHANTMRRLARGGFSLDWAEDYSVRDCSASGRSWRYPPG